MKSPITIKISEVDIFKVYDPVLAVHTSTSGTTIIISHEKPQIQMINTYWSWLHFFNHCVDQSRKLRYPIIVEFSLIEWLYDENIQLRKSYVCVCVFIQTCDLNVMVSFRVVLEIFGLKVAVSCNLSHSAPRVFCGSPMQYQWVFA